MRRNPRIRSNCCELLTDSRPPCKSSSPATCFPSSSIRATGPAIRAKVMEHKRTRQVGRRARTSMWLFEDRITIQYQVQEMLRAERIFEQEGIRGRAGGLQPAHPGRQQLEGDAAHRVPGRAGAPHAAGPPEGRRRTGCWVQVAGPAKGVRDRRRGSRARERREDLVGAFPALRAGAADDCGDEGVGRRSRWGWITTSTGTKSTPCRPRCKRRSKPT